MRPDRRAAALGAALVLAACGAATEGGPSGLALGLSLPRPLAAVPAYAPQADVTELTEQAIRIELYQDGVFVLGRTIGLTGDATVLEGLVPGEDYELSVLAGLRGAGETLGIVQFEGSAEGIRLPPDEVVAVDVPLVECTPRPALSNCDPDFGFQREVPAPPTLFRLPPRSSCRDLSLAGRKPDGTVLLANEERVVSVTGPTWTWNIAQLIPITQTGADTLSRQLKSAWSDQQQIVSEAQPMQIEYNPSALCFNPYAAGGTDVERDGADLRLRWRAGGRNAGLAAIALPIDVTAATTLASLPETAETLGRADATAAAGELTLAAPTDEAWGLYLYAEAGGNWLLEGVFLYHEDWIALERPGLLPP